MRTSLTWLQTAIAVAAASCLAAALSTAANAAAPETPVAGKEVHFPVGNWSGSPQLGPDGKVRQCVLLALRPRPAPDGVGGRKRFIDIVLVISRGVGLAILLIEDTPPSEAVLDDQAEIIIGEQTFPAVAFTVANSNKLASHPGDAAGVLEALGKAKTLRVRADGAGTDTGPIELNLPGEALAWLQQCGQMFNIAIDRPTAVDAPALPAPRPRSPEIVPAAPTAAPPSLEDKQTIAGWDAWEQRTIDGRVAICYIRHRYSPVTDITKPADRKAPVFSNVLFVSRGKGLVMALRNTDLDQPENQPVEATFAIDGKPFTAFSAHMLAHDVIGLFPEHGAAFARALGDGVTFNFKSALHSLEYPIPAGVVPWLRACARRNGFSFEPAAGAN